MRDPERVHDGAFLYDDDRLYFGTDRDSSIKYDAANARLTVQTKDAVGAHQDVVTVEANSGTPTTRIAAGIFSIEVATTFGEDVAVADGYGLVVGHGILLNVGGIVETQVLGTGAADGSVLVGRFDAGSAPPRYRFVKGRGTSIGDLDAVLDNDRIGMLSWYPADGTDLSTEAARFYAEVDDSSPSVGDIGMAFVWEHMKGDAGGLVETLRLDALGHLTLSHAGATDDVVFTVKNSSDVANADAYLIARAGGTSAGDAKIIFVIEGSNQIDSGDRWALGIDNSTSHDPLVLSADGNLGVSALVSFDAFTGATVSTRRTTLHGLALSASDSASPVVRMLTLEAQTIDYTGTTQVTSQQNILQIGKPDLSQSGGALTIDAAATMHINGPPAPNTDVTLTHSSALRIGAISAGGSPNGTAINAVGVAFNASSTWTYLLDFNVGGGARDVPLIHVQVDDDPQFIWDDSEDAFSINKGLRITSGVLEVGSPQTYLITNVTTDRDVDADTVDVATLADVVGTLIDDLRTIGLVN